MTPRPPIDPTDPAATRRAAIDELAALLCDACGGLHDGACPGRAFVERVERVDVRDLVPGDVLDPERAVVYVLARWWSDDLVRDAGYELFVYVADAGRPGASLRYVGVTDVPAAYAPSGDAPPLDGATARATAADYLAALLDLTAPPPDDAVLVYREVP